MVSKHISIWRTHLTVQINFLDFEISNLDRKHFGSYATEIILVTLYIYIYIYIYMLTSNEYPFPNYSWSFRKMHLYSTPYLHFQSSNGRSEPLKMFSMLKCAWRPNFTFFGIFLLFIKPLWNRWSNVNSKNFWTIRSAIFKVA